MMRNQSIQTEIDAAYLYDILADHEEDAEIAAIFRQMGAIEHEHAQAFARHHQILPDQLPGPSTRARILSRIGKIFGNNYILGVLLDTEKGLSGSIHNLRKRTGAPASLSDTAHVSILKNILSHPGRIAGTSLARFEKRHRSVGGNALRAAVLGGNDGLISNFSLVMGMAGATGGQREALLAGIAGLLAGSLSMALGEWISVRSSQELYEHQMQLEMEELEVSPDTEQKELALIYRSKGIPASQAEKMAADMMQHKDEAHQVLVREELGINPEELKGSAMEAALASFFLFAAGAIIPVIPFFFKGGFTAVILSAAVSAIGLFGIGALITLVTGRNVWTTGLRQVLFGLAAAAVTYGIGTLIGVTIMG